MEFAEFLTVARDAGGRARWKILGPFRGSGSLVLVREMNRGAEATLVADHASGMTLAGQILRERDVAGAEAVDGAVVKADLDFAFQRDHVLAAGGVVPVVEVAGRSRPEHDALGRMQRREIRALRTCPLGDCSAMWRFSWAPRLRTTVFTRFFAARRPRRWGADVSQARPEARLWVREARAHDDEICTQGAGWPRDRHANHARQALAQWRTELIVDEHGGPDVVTTQQRAIVDLAVKTKLLLDSIDAWLFAQKSLVNATRRSVYPVVLQRQQMADPLARYMKDLGLERRAKPAPDLTGCLAKNYGGKRSPQGLRSAVVAVTNSSVSDSPEAPPAPDDPVATAAPL